MALTPVLLLVNERLVAPRVGTRESAREADAIDEHAPVIIAGFGRFGHIVGRLLRANGVGTTVLDNDSDRVELLRRLGLKVFYGDASRHDLLDAAGASKAKLLVLALDSPEKTLELVHTAKKHFPHLTILARAADRDDAYALIDAGVTHIYRETLDTSLRMGVDALRLLGFRAYHARTSRADVPAARRGVAARSCVACAATARRSCRPRGTASPISSGSCRRTWRTRPSIATRAGTRNRCDRSSVVGDR